VVGVYGPTLPSGWQLVATADFNGDGKPDYLLYNASTGQTAIWYLNNNVCVGGVYGPTVPVGWSLVSSVDFNGDGKTDYLLFNATTGQSAIWYLNNNVYVSGVYGPTLPSGWQLTGAVDYNGDGHPDYSLFNATSGQTAIWYLNNNVYVTGVYGPTLPAGWVAMGSIATSTLAQLTATDVTQILHHAIARAVAISSNSVIAVTDREGNVLGVWVVPGGSAADPEVATAVSKAGTAAYLSSNQNAFTSRTAGFIIQQHFPPGVNNTPTGPLVGVGLSNLFISDINKFRKPGSVISFSPTPGNTILPVPNTSLDGLPGGVPLYKNGQLVGGIGVTGAGIPGPISGFRAENPFIFISGYDKDEDIALAGQDGYAPASGILATNVFIGGIRLPYVNSSTVFSDGSQQGNADSRYPIRAAPPPFAYPVETLGGVSGQIRQPIINDPMAGTINGQPRLTAQEVRSILSYAAQRTSITRAAIRLPIGVPMKAFITVVNNPNTAGDPPTVLGTFRTGEATLFSWDVSVQKARTVIYYSSHDFLNFGVMVAMSVRAVGFLAQCNYPPGIDGNPPGPFNGQQEMFSRLAGNHCDPGAITFPGGALNPSLPNGITIFPGAFGLYRNGVLIGAIGVSGDGVDQDDIVGASGTHDFLAPENIRSDQFFFRGTRLPYAKFPRDPGP